MNIDGIAQDYVEGRGDDLVININVRSYASMSRHNYLFSLPNQELESLGYKTSTIKVPFR